MKSFFSRTTTILLLLAFGAVSPLVAAENDNTVPPPAPLFQTNEAEHTAPPEQAFEEDTALAASPPEVVPGDTPQAPPALRPEHIQYMVGFNDGSMKPDKALSRAEAVSLIYRLMSAPESGNGQCFYTDVHDSDWFAVTVRALARLGMLEAGTTFRPNDAITRGEFISILVHFAPDVPPSGHFSDVPPSHPQADSIGKAVTMSWVSGFPDGTFGPARTLSRAEACAILNRITGRSGDAARAHLLLGLGLYRDVPQNHWAGTTICEATVSHSASGVMASENWYDLDYDTLRFAPGIHNISDTLYAVDRHQRLVRNQRIGAYVADANGILTATASGHQTQVPYISMLDGLGATVGCEPISALMGLRTKGFATTTDPRTFLARLPYSDSNPEYGFVGSPYHSDGRYSSINPRPLTAYCNSYCQGTAACADFSGASIDALRQELLCGNLIVSYQTYWWQSIRYANFLIDGRWKAMVANNHVRLIAGYDPVLGYFVSDPYNPQSPGKPYQYWIDAQTFENLWNQRKMGMVIR